MSKIKIVKTINILFFLCGMYSTVYSQTEILRFIQVSDNDQWESVLTNAQKDDKLIFVDLYSEGCVSCLETETTTFKNSKVIAYFNSHFINVKIDIDSKVGLEFVHELNIKSIPAFLFSDASGHRISEVLEGGRSADALLDRGDYYYEAYSGMQKLKEKYYSKAKDDMILLDYVYSLINLNYNLEGKLIADQYFNNCSVFSYSPQEWRLIRKYLNDIRDPKVKQFLSQDTVFSSIYGKQEVNKYLTDLFSYNYSTAVLNKDTSLLEASLGILDHVDIAEMNLGTMPLNQVKDYFRISYLEKNEEWDAYSKKVVDFMAKYIVNESDKRDFIIKFCQNVNANEMIILADGWAKSLLKKKKSFENFVCYALTEDRLGNKDNALKMLNKAGKYTKDENERIMLVELIQQITGIKK